MRTEIVLSGYGGQGLLLAGGILGEAAAIYQGLMATNSQTYGVQARGGESRSEIIISDQEINYAEIEHPDILLAMSQGALDRFADAVKEDALIIIDTGFVDDVSCITKTQNIKKFPITAIAIKETGKSILANIVALAIITELTGVIGEDSLKQAVTAKAPKGTEQLNYKAMLSGIKAVRSQNNKNESMAACCV